MDCEDGSDEEQCGTIAPMDVKTNITLPSLKNMCPQHYFQCYSGLSYFLFFYSNYIKYINIHDFRYK